MSKLSVLLVDAGANVSIKDVSEGYRKALALAGHTVYHYALDLRLNHSGRYLLSAWRMMGRTGVKPGWPDVLYHAGTGLLERYLRFLPDWVIAVSGMYLHPDVVVLLRRAGARVALILTESPYDDEAQLEIARQCSLVFATERASVPWFRARLAAPVLYLPHGHDPAVHRPGLAALDPPDTPRHDVVLVATGFQERIDLLAHVDWDGIDLGLYGTWDLLPSRHKLRKYLRGKTVPNERTAQLYRAAKVGLNLYRSSRGYGVGTPKIDAGEAESVSPRVLELAADGAFFLGDERAEQRELFGDALPTFARDDPAGLGAAIRHWLGHDAERRAVAARLPALVAGRTFGHTAAYLVDCLQQTEPARSGEGVGDGRRDPTAA